MKQELIDRINHMNELYTSLGERLRGLPFDPADGSGLSIDKGDNGEGWQDLLIDGRPWHKATAARRMEAAASIPGFVDKWHAAMCDAERRLDALIVVLRKAVTDLDPK